MLHKCANPPCVSLFRSMHQGKLFMVESEPQEKDSQYSLPATGQRKHRSLRMEHYWLCDKCSPLVTLTFTKGLGLIMVPLLPPQARVSEVKKATNSVQVGELLPSRSGGRREMA
jgi:hypothetical protein